ncbi:FecR family protein [Flavobacterium sp. RHBU_24]|uniref:FecR family protein n=1 Tax=Flavobacterium sp. RHBU_24 TaxID=3391185 RepID=UPI0039852CB4
MNNDIKLAKWLNDEMDETELKEFESLPEFATYNNIKKYSAQLTAPEADLEGLYTKISKNKYRTAPTKVRRINAWVPRIAAVLFIALGLSFFFYVIHTTEQLTANGDMAMFTLPDDSEVTLNAGSEISYKEYNWSDNRRVELNGEAYFKAAKGKTFDVVTPLGTISVVGTQFNVKARGNRLDVTCFEGKVKVATANDTILLTPGETVAYEGGANLHLPAVTRTEPGWIHHEAVFVSENFNNVITELERQFDIKIVVNGTLPQKSYNGTIPTREKDKNTALDMVITAYNLKYKKQGDKIVLTAE